VALVRSLAAWLLVPAVARVRGIRPRLRDPARRFGEPAARPSGVLLAGW
jgi:hypothetical protein